MKLLIVEPSCSGHHMILYTRSIIRLAIKHFDISIMTTKNSFDDETFKIIINECPKKINVHFIENLSLNNDESAFSLLLNQYKYFKSIKICYNKIYKTDKPDFVYMVNLDHFDKIISLLGSPFKDTIYSGMLMNIKFHRKIMGIGDKSRFDVFYYYLFRRLCNQKYLNRIMIVDEVFEEFLNKKRHKSFKKILKVKEPVNLIGNETSESARINLGIKKSDFVILLYGSLSLRKGILELLNAFYELDIPDLKIIIAGKIHNDLGNIFDDFQFIKCLNERKIFFFPGFQNDISQYRLFKASDSVWVGYINGFSGSSGVIYQAATLGLPILATNYGLIGWILKKYQIGLSFNVNNCEEVKENIKIMYYDKDKYNFFSQKCIKLSRNHSIENFSETIINSILNYLKIEL